MGHLFTSALLAVRIKDQYGTLITVYGRAESPFFIFLNKE